MSSLARSILFCLILSLLAPFSAKALEDYSEIFERAVDAVDFEFDRNWAYTETRIDDEHVWVGRSDPRRPSSKRWQ
ncbi:MAG: hypothetical protein ACR2QI_05330, partial [Woeseiaceae bacterium]